MQLQTLEPIEPYEKAYDIHFGQIDNRGVARPSAFFEMAQDAATLHAYEIGLSREGLNALWVLSRVKMKLTRPLRPYEHLTVQTWCAGMKGAAWIRPFRFRVGNEPVGDAVSTWALLDQTTHRIIRPQTIEQTKRYAGITVDPSLLPGKLACESLTEHHIHPVCYSDLDVNNHVNNVKIADIVSDGLDLNLGSDYVSAFQVNYTMESHHGDRLRILTGEENGTRYVFGEADGKIHFEGAATLTPMP